MDLAFLDEEKESEGEPSAAMAEASLVEPVAMPEPVLIVPATIAKPASTVPAIAPRPTLDDPTARVEPSPAVADPNEKVGN